MTNRLTYWQRRFLRIAQLRDKKDQAYIKRMLKSYDDLASSVYEEIQEWVTRYADNDGITEDAAYEQLSKSEQKTWSMTLKQFRAKAIAGGYDNELNKEYFKSRINRLEQLERQLYFELAEMANNQEGAMADYLKETLNETYLRQIYEFTDRGSFSIDFSRYSSKALELAILNPWQGSNFSRRIWKNHLKDIPNRLSKVMSLSISQGWGVDRTVKEMMKGFDSVLKNRMTTLVQTESAHIAEVASQKSYEETGVEKYEWLATLEAHTCDKPITINGKTYRGCGGLDGETFEVIEREAPKPPVHPNCRCTTVPVIEGWETISRWQRDPITGKGSVGEYQTFEQWKESLEKPKGQKMNLQLFSRDDKKDFLEKVNNGIYDKTVADNAIKLYNEIFQKAVKTPIGKVVANTNTAYHIFNGHPDMMDPKNIRGIRQVLEAPKIVLETQDRFGIKATTYIAKFGDKEMMVVVRNKLVTAYIPGKNYLERQKKKGRVIYDKNNQ